jgi:isoquinoline 1-oxidoreductase beta subunit
VKLKQSEAWTNIGTSIPRVDVPAKTDGTAIYGIDVAVPVMKYAAITMCPMFGGKLKSYDAADVLSRPGILKVVEIKMMQPGGKDEGAVESDNDALAVIADQWWLASKAVQDIKIEWDGGDWATAGSASILSNMRTGLAMSPDKVLRRDGDVEAAMDSAAQVLEAEYLVPYLEHATMEGCRHRIGQQDRPHRLGADGSRHTL